MEPYYSETEIENLEEIEKLPNTFLPSEYELSDEEPDVPLNIYTRQAWGALPPKYETPLEVPVRMWLFVWSNTKVCRNRKNCMKAMRELQRRDMFEQGMPDIQYNFYIGRDLNIYEGRGWRTASTETYKLYSEIETKIFDICYIGRYRHEDFPHVEVMQVMQEFIRFGRKQRYIRKHHQMLPTLVDRNWDPWRGKPLKETPQFP